MFSPPLLFCPRCSQNTTSHPPSYHSPATVPKSRDQEARQPCMAIMMRFGDGQRL